MTPMPDICHSIDTAMLDFFVFSNFFLKYY